MFIINRVTPNLAISDIYAAKHEPTLRKHGITHILSLLSFQSIGPAPAFIKDVKTMGVLDYPEENIIDEFAETYAFIDAAINGTTTAATGTTIGTATGKEDQGTGTVLVHCQAGISRSSTIVTAYLMRHHGISREEAFEMVRKVRGHVKPNAGFWDQLGVYEACGYAPRRGIAAYDAWEKRQYDPPEELGAGAGARARAGTTVGEASQVNRRETTTTAKQKEVELLAKDRAKL